MIKGNASSGAIFNDSEDRRFLLWRSREKGHGIVTFILLNPSTADENKNDPTVLRCWTRAQALGFKTMLLTNLFSFRSTNPKGIQIDRDGDLLENTVTIRRCAVRSNLVICAWGNHGKLERRGHQILGGLRGSGIDVHVFGISKQGEPIHPLYLPYGLETKRLDWDSIRIDGGSIVFENKEAE